ncbi:MAG TPA: hypothetical protein VF712_13410 [Thermoleophilaceae bacterium]
MAVDVVPAQGATTLEISNDGTFVPATTFAVVRGRYPWVLSSGGPEQVPKRVYVRFRGSSAFPPTDVFADSIVLDRTRSRVLPPVIASVHGSVSTIRVSAADRTAGVAGLQVTTNPRRPGGLRPYRRKVRLRAGRGAAIYVRAIDRAGNRSSWHRAR